MILSKEFSQGDSWCGIFAPFLGVLTFALACAPGRLCAQEEATGKVVLPSATDADGQDTAGSVPDPGTGNFKRSPFRVTMSVREGYDDNVYTTNQDPVSSFFTSGNVAIGYIFGNARTRLDLEASGGATYYYNRPFGQQYDINSGLNLTAAHRATPRLELAAAVFLTYQSEPDFSTGFGINRRVGNYFYTNDKFSASYQWSPRFSTVTSYTLGAINYKDSTIGTYEDRFEHTFENEFRYLVLPTTTLVGEYRYEIINYKIALRDSTTNFALAGLDHTFSPHFNLSFRGGAEFQQIELLGERTSPYGEVTLNYAPSPRTSLKWTSHFGLDQGDAISSPSRTAFRMGIIANYAFSPRLTSNLSLYYENDQNHSLFTPSAAVPSFNENLLDTGLGVRYQINRYLAATASYDRTQILSQIAFREYARNRYYLGLNAMF